MSERRGWFASSLIGAVVGALIATAIPLAMAAGGTSRTDADTVDGFDANDLVRTVVQKRNDPLRPDEGILLARSIEVPTDGYLLITASVQAVRTSGASDGYACYLTLGNKELADTWRFAPFVDPSGWDSTICSTMGWVKVTAGTKLIRFRGPGLPAGANFDPSHPVMWAVFVPFGPDGLQP